MSDYKMLTNNGYSTNSRHHSWTIESMATTRTETTSWTHLFNSCSNGN